MSAANRRKCNHQNCSCMAAGDSKFCSPHCVYVDAPSSLAGNRLWNYGQSHREMRKSCRGIMGMISLIKHSIREGSIAAQAR